MSSSYLAFVIGVSRLNVAQSMVHFRSVGRNEKFVCPKYSSSSSTRRWLSSSVISGPKRALPRPRYHHVVARLLGKRHEWPLCLRFHQTIFLPRQNKIRNARFNELAYSSVPARLLRSRRRSRLILFYQRENKILVILFSCCPRRSSREKLPETQ